MDESISIPRRVLVVAAHPDDAEGGAGGTVAKWVRLGAEAHILIATNGDKGDDEAKSTPEELAAIRASEARAAADILGVTELVILPLRDGELISGIDLRGDVDHYLRRWQPDVVLTHDPRVVFGARGGVNHADHRAIGEATLDAVFHFNGGPHHYPEQITEGLTPHVIRGVLLWGAEHPDHWEDVTGFVDCKIEALQQHHSQFGDPQRTGQRTRERLAQVGAMQGLGFAEAFAHVRLVAVSGYCS